MIPIYHLFSKIILCCNTSSVWEVDRSVGDCRGGHKYTTPFGRQTFFSKAKFQFFFKSEANQHTCTQNKSADKIFCAPKKVSEKFFCSSKCQKRSFKMGMWWWWWWWWWGDKYIGVPPYLPFSWTYMVSIVI